MKLSKFFYIIFFALSSLYCGKLYENVPLIDDTPPKTPAIFTSTAGEKQIELKWSLPDDPDLSKVVVIKKINNEPALITDPAIYSGKDNSYVDKDILFETVYYYTLFACDNSNNFSEPIMISAKCQTGEQAKPDFLKNVVFDLSGNSLTIKWSKPEDSTISGIRIVRKDGTKETGYPLDYTDGTSFSKTTDDVEFIDSGLLSGRYYFYSIYTYNESNAYSNPVQNHIKLGVDNSAPPEVSNMKAEYANGFIQFSWANPTVSNFGGVRLLKRTGSYDSVKYPANPEDGKIMVDGVQVYFLDAYDPTNTDDKKIRRSYKIYTYNNSELPNFSVGYEITVLFTNMNEMPRVHVKCMENSCE